MEEVEKHPDKAERNALRRITPDMLNFSWAMLVAVRLAQQTTNQSPLQQHIFIMRWLESAQKRHLFPKTVAREIAWFISDGRRLGYRAELCTRAEYIWRAGTDDPDQQSALRRVTGFLEAMKKLGWCDTLLSDAEWRTLKVDPELAPTLWIRKSDLYAAFNAFEEMTMPLEMKINKTFDGINLLAQDADLKIIVSGHFDNLTVMSISA